MQPMKLTSQRWFYPVIYGLLSLTHWFNPDLVWMGVMHIPLLVVPLVALFLPVLERDLRTLPRQS